MSRVQTRQSGEKVLDGPTLTKLKEHNKGIYQQKKQDAVALRQKLEQWKEEKRKQKLQEQKSKTVPFVTTVLKPAQNQIPGQGNKSKPPVSRKSVGVPLKHPTTSKHGFAQSKPAVVPVKKEPLVKRRSHQPFTAPKHQKIAEKENKKTARKAAPPSVDVKHGKERDTSATTGSDDCSRLSANELTTPLSHNAAGGIRHVITDITARAEEGQGQARPLSLAEELQATFNIKAESGAEKTSDENSEKIQGDDDQAVDGPKKTSEPAGMDSSDKNQEDKKPADDLSQKTDEEDRPDASVFPPLVFDKPSNTARDSLSAQFRRGKKNPTPKIKVCGMKKASPKVSRSVPRPTAVRRASCSTSVSCTKTTISNQPKSILKRKSCGVSFRSSALGVGASPLLPAASKPHQKTREARAAKTGGVTFVKRATIGNHENVGRKTPGGDQQGASGHVTFVMTGKAGSEGAKFRKTPGKSQAQVHMREFGRLRLEEWMAAKGRTSSGLRHTGCFGCEASARCSQTPRSQVRASMSVEQLSRQETNLTKEDTASLRSASANNRTFTQNMGQASPTSPLQKDSAGILCTPTSAAGEGVFRQGMETTETGGVEVEDTRGLVYGRAEGAVEVEDTRGMVYGRAEGAVEVEDTRGMVYGRAEGAVEVEDTRGMVYGRAEGAVEVEDTRGMDYGSPEDVEAEAHEERAEDEPHMTSGAEQLNSDLQKCLASIEAGSLSTEVALEWLGLVGQACDEVKQQAAWYKCRVAALKPTGDQDALLAVFEEAFIHGAQPADEMAHLLTETMKELLEKAQSRRKRKRKSSVSAASASSARRSSQRASHQPDVQAENMFQSTKVKYSVVEVTPFKKRRRMTDADDRLVPVVTPVRRSARFDSTSTAPASEGRLPPGTPHMAEYSTLEELPSEEKEQMLFQPNQALEPLLQDQSPVARRLSMSNVD